jgi:hypothetical protein
MRIDVELERWSGSPVTRPAGASYSRQPAALFRDEPADLTSRQAVFYRNLIRIAEAVGTERLPVDFELPDGTRQFLDRGCIKIAEHAGFIRPLENDLTGVVACVVLTFHVRKDG